MLKSLIFKKITFKNYSPQEFNKILNKNGLFLFPAGPALALLDKNKLYHKSLIQADHVFFDSGFFVLLLKIFKNIKVQKFSGYLFIRYFIKHLLVNKNKKIISVDPNSNFSKSNYNFFLKIGLKKKNIINYVSPIYDNSNIKDKKLLNIIKLHKPDYVLINIGGSTQEILGLYIKKNIKVRKYKIICTGAAISFFTGDQAPINVFFDKFFLGWLIRILFNPKLYLLRYIRATKLCFLVFKEKVIIKL